MLKMHIQEIPYESIAFTIETLLTELSHSKILTCGCEHQCVLKIHEQRP